MNSLNNGYNTGENSEMDNWNGIEYWNSGLASF